ncbi:MAG TPA: hypothetical protein VEH27_00625 [Methylomirabilota bacterium]|nr:hypothetical protein [Methylomirabilota bacterium]
MTKIKVEVTDADIRHGQSGNCWRCPVALAIKRVTRAQEVNVTAIDVSVWGDSVVLDTPPTSSAWTTKRLSDPCWSLERVQLPTVVRAWIRAFDDNKPVRPFFFHLEVPWL